MAAAASKEFTKLQQQPEIENRNKNKWFAVASQQLVRL